MNNIDDNKNGINDNDHERGGSNEQLIAITRAPRIGTDTRLQRPEFSPTSDQALWSAIRNRTDAIGFDRYSEFINRLLCAVEPDGTDKDEGRPVCGSNNVAELLGAPTIAERREDLLAVPSIHGVDAYNLLKIATQAFLLLETGVAIKKPRDAKTGEHTGDITDLLLQESARRGETVTFQQLETTLRTYLTPSLPPNGGNLPYLKRILEALVGLDGAANQNQKLPYCDALLRNRFSCPSMLELIWSYWNEEGMLAQTMNAICLRFQNRRGPADRDPLANLEIDPLRPLNNLLWGYIQDEYSRLTVVRRAYEYDHHYGLTLQGKAVSELRSADSRSKFLEGFHNLLYRAAGFYREDADTTVISDGFALLNALREVHLLLAEGAHNQFGDLPWTSRAEMLLTQWLLARPEMREFLRGRAMVPYNERWMGQVDTMKKLQGWTDTTITHFRNLAIYGEQMLLSIRYGDWIGINDQESAKNWARYWRPEIQGYIHAYQAATGVDLSEEIVDTRRAAVRYVQPSILLRNRLMTQGGQGSLPASSSADAALPAGAPDMAALPGASRRRLPRGRTNERGT